MIGIFTSGTAMALILPFSRFCLEIVVCTIGFDPIEAVIIRGLMRSSSRMVPVALALWKTALVGVVRFKWNDLLISGLESLIKIT